MFFQIIRGVRQGCPLSSYNVIICVEALTIQKLSNNAVRGIPIIEVKLLQYAGDTTISLDGSYDSKNFDRASGLKINNMDKTNIFPLGSFVH